MENHGATPPPLSPHSPPPTRGPWGRRPPTPPEGRGDSPPSPRKDRGVRGGGGGAAGSASTPHAACCRRNRDGQTNPRQRTRTPHGPRPGTASAHKPERYGGHALHGQSDAKDTRFVACPGKAEGRTEVRRPPAPLAPPVAPPGRTARGLPPPPHPTSPGVGTPQTRRPTPQGAHSPKPGRGGTGPGRSPPEASQMEHGTEAGRAEGHGPRGTVLPAPSTWTARGARATPTRGGGGGARTPRERERTDTQRTDGEYHKGNRTEPAERTDRMEWRTSERGKGTPGRDGPPHTARETRGGKGETEMTQHPAPAPTPPNQPRGPRTHDQDTASAKAVVAHRATHQPHG